MFLTLNVFCFFCSAFGNDRKSQVTVSAWVSLSWDSISLPWYEGYCLGLGLTFWPSLSWSCSYFLGLVPRYKDSSKHLTTDKKHPLGQLTLHHWPNFGKGENKRSVLLWCSCFDRSILMFLMREGLQCRRISILKHCLMRLWNDINQLTFVFPFAETRSIKPL